MLNIYQCTYVCILRNIRLIYIITYNFPKMILSQNLK